MKTLIQYIKEAVEEYRLNSVIAKYNVEPEEIILEAPETYDESDIQIYMGDLWLEKLPSGPDYSEKFFGKNNDSINDVYFEYDTFEHMDVEPKDYIQWDAKYDKKTEGQKLDYFRIKNLKYVISFDRFDLVDATDDNVKEILLKIFKVTDSSPENEFPIEIKFDEDSLEYHK